MDEDDNELPVLPRIDKGPPPDCPICGDPMSFIDGEDFVFNPILLRIPFAASVLYSPTWAVVAYFALGAVVLASRLLFPKAKGQPVLEAADQPEPVNEQREYAKAA
jgi:hypothetical protein